MGLTPELRAQFSPVRELFFEAAGKIQPSSVDAYAAVQRVFNLMEVEEQGMLGEVAKKPSDKILIPYLWLQVLPLMTLLKPCEKAAYKS